MTVKGMLMAEYVLDNWSSSAHIDVLLLRCRLVLRTGWEGKVWAEGDAIGLGEYDSQIVGSAHLDLHDWCVGEARRCMHRIRGVSVRVGGTSKHAHWRLHAKAIYEAAALLTCIICIYLNLCVGMVRSYRVESARSHQNSEAKRLWVWSVLSSVTWREAQMTNCFCRHQGYTITQTICVQTKGNSIWF